MYHPEDHGALCRQCILKDLRDGDPVGIERHTNAMMLVVGEAPGEEEVIEGRPFVGSSGRLLMKYLTAARVDRSHCSITNAVCCRPEGNNFDLLRAKHQKLNRNRKAQGLAPLPPPEVCCWPRLLAEIRQHKNLLVLGKTAYQSVCHTKKSVLEIRGGPVTGVYTPEGRFLSDPQDTPLDKVPPTPIGHHRVRILPTVHPSFVLHRKSFVTAFRLDIERAVRWYRHGLRWKEPKITYMPSPAQLKAFLDTPRKFTVCDIETTLEGPLWCTVYCVGFGTETEAMVCGFTSSETGQQRYGSDEPHIKQIIKNFLEDKTKIKVGHNFGYFDRIVLERWLNCHIENVRDTILIHRAAESELPHKLAYVGSVYTDAPAWKSDNLREYSPTDFARDHYNALDCCINAQCLTPLVQAAKARKQYDIAIQKDSKLQEVCCDLHRVGLLVDQRRRAEYDAEFKAKAHAKREEVRQLLNNYKFNPASVQQLVGLLFEKWKLPVIRETERGNPSTDDETIRKLLIDRYVSQQQKKLLSGIRWFRKYAKMRGYFRQLASAKMSFGVDDLCLSPEEDEEQKPAEMDYDEWKYRLKETKKEEKRNKAKIGLVREDGRIHASWNCHGTVTRRFSSSEPNMQNIPRSIRDMFIPQPGCKYVYADMDQLELRIITNLSGAHQYVEAFATGFDPHTITVISIYGDEGKKAYEEAIKLYGKNYKDDHKDFSRMRDFGKRFVYAASYKAMIPTIHDTITSVENDKGELIYANVKIDVIRKSYDAWIAANPEIAAWWDKTINTFNVQGFLIEPVNGWRRDFIDSGEKEQELVNFVPQSAGAALVGDATIELVFDHGLRIGKWGKGTGLVHHCHDSLTFEVPESEVDVVKQAVSKAMARTVPGWPIGFSGEAKIYANLRDKEKKK